MGGVGAKFFDFFLPFLCLNSLIVYIGFVIHFAISLYTNILYPIREKENSGGIMENNYCYIIIVYWQLRRFGKF